MVDAELEKLAEATRKNGGQPLADAEKQQLLEMYRSKVSPAITELFD
jgi:hypothetical protein